MPPLSIGLGRSEPATLDGTWLIHGTSFSWDASAPPPADDPGWRKIEVPGAWEAQGFAPAAEGPFWYRRDFSFSPRQGERAVLRFHGVSTRCRILVNGRETGVHEGIWDGFESDVTPHLVSGRNSLHLLVQKAGDALPLRQAVAGFLPDVCVLFGGPWQPVEIAAKGPLALHVLHLRADAETRRLHVAIRGEQQPGATRAQMAVTVTDPAGREAAHAVHDLAGRPGAFAADLHLDLPSVRRWDPEEPNLYTVRVETRDGQGLSDRASRRFGWRTLQREGSRILLNGRPLLLRGLLHWGWYPGTVAPLPTREQILVELRAARESGFNLIKHCLYVPVDDYFDLADELGILLWQELPLWLPDVTPILKDKVFCQYPAIMERLHSHPSLVIWSLGCELNADADGGFLARLYALASETAGDALIRDNSGSGECYGGLLDEHADFYDYHFYTDPHFYRPLMDRFAADWRAPKPWLFGEFCDQDEVRDIAALRRANGGDDPWWLAPPSVADLRRDHLGYARENQRLEEAGLLARVDDLAAASRRKALAYRKTVLETVRQYAPLSGYVLTSLRDTPLSTSAFFDDFGRVKHPPEEWLRCNAETILTLAWDSRRDWINGGDRLCCWDPYNYRGGQVIRAHPVVSHYGREPLTCEDLAWRLTTAADGILARGALAPDHTVEPGTLAELGAMECPAPDVPEITACLLTAEVTGHIGDRRVILANSWPLWLYPPDATAPPQGALLHDPYGLLPGCALPRCAGEAPGPDTLLVTTGWDAAAKVLAQGGQVLYIQPGDGPLPNTAGPFWREALQIFAAPEVFAGFTGEGYCGLQWYSLATDRSFALAELETFFGGRATLRPLLRRLDTRRYLLREYAVGLTLGAGRAILTTLRLAGGLGDQAADHERTVAGQALLARMVRALGELA